MRHHTKDKGDAGLGFVIADLLSQGVQVALPMSEHLPFDCIAISQSNELRRISVKYRGQDKFGTITVALKSCWSDSHGCHIRTQDKSLFDATAVYCPETKACYYVRNDEVGRSFKLRLRAPRNNQQKGVLLASAFSDPNRIFNGPVV